MHKYPPFSQTEYNCFTDNLSIVEYYLNLEKLEDTLTSKKIELANLQEQMASCEAVIIPQMLKSATAALTARSDSQRKAELKAIVEHMQKRRKLNGRRNDPFDETVAVLRLYGAIDKEQFDKDCKEIFGDLDITEKEDQVKKLAAEIDRLYKQIDKLKGDYERHFKYIPKYWRTASVAGKDEDAIKRSRANMARLVMLNFIKDWKERAPLFDREVTVTGVSIGSLPRKKRAGATKAYKQLGLDAIEKTPVFDAIISDEREPVGA